MARRNRGLTKQAIQKRWKEGRGQGEGEFYQPWLTVRDVSSRGQSNRPLGWKTGRAHRLLSLNELRYLYVLDDPSEAGAEHERVSRLISEGKMEQMFLAEDRSRGWLVMLADSEGEALEAVQMLLFYPFMNIDVIPLVKTYP